MSLKLLYAVVAVLWVASMVGCCVALRWSFLRVPKRFVPSVILSISALLIGYLGRTNLHLVASETVNGQVKWSFDSKWWFLALAVAGAGSLGVTLWKQAHQVPENDSKEIP